MEVDVITEVGKKTAASFKVLLSQGWEKNNVVWAGFDSPRFTLFNK